MKWLFLIAIPLLLSTNSVAEQKTPLRFAFWNVLVDFAVDKWSDDDIPLWYWRKEKAKKFVSEVQADVYGFAEVLPWQSDSFQESLNGYERVQYSQYTDAVLFYKKSRFIEVRRGWMFLSNRPEEGWSTDFGNFMPRILVWAELKTCTSCTPFVVMSTHLDGMNVARMAMVKLIEKQIQTHFPQRSVVLMGDFNISFEDLGYKIIRSQNWLNTYHLNGALHGSLTPTRGRRQIDHIFLINNRNFSITDWQVKKSIKDKMRLSDHDMVTADLFVQNLFQVSTREPKTTPTL